jgi:transposase
MRAKKYKPKKGVVVGIDVSKDFLDASTVPKRDASRFKMSDLKMAVEWVVALRASLVVIEASGGYEEAVWAALDEAGVPVAVVNPLYVRRFAQSGGQHAKNDRLDADVLAEYGVAKKPRVTPYHGNRQLRELLKRRGALIEQWVAERNRLKQAKGTAVQELILESIAFVNAQRKRVDKEIARELEKTTANKRKVEVLTSTPGIGKATAMTLVIMLPELGTLCRRKIAKLVGLAPFTRESGKWKGKRFIGHGRAAVRAALYMPTLVATRSNPIIRAYYKRLRAAGKAHKVALTACMRKLLTILNAMMRSNTTWAANPESLAGSVPDPATQAKVAAQ